MIHSLAEWNPVSVLYYKWGYSLTEIKDLFNLKTKEYANKRSIDFKFLIDLAKAALGGGKSEDTIELDDGTGLSERTDEQDEDLRAMLGDDYAHVVGG